MRNSSAYVTAAALALLALAGCQSSGSSTNAQASSDPWWKFGYGSSKSAPSNNVASNAPFAPANPTLPSAVTSPGTPMNGAGTSGSFAGSPYLPPASSQDRAYPGTNSTGSIYGAGGGVAGWRLWQNAFAASPARTATPTAYESPAYPSSGYPATSYPQTAYPGTASSYGAPGNSTRAHRRPAIRAPETTRQRLVRRRCLASRQPRKSDITDRTTDSPPRLQQPTPMAPLLPVTAARRFWLRQRGTAQHGPARHGPARQCLRQHGLWRRGHGKRWLWCSRAQRLRSYRLWRHARRRSSSEPSFARGRKRSLWQQCDLGSFGQQQLASQCGGRQLASGGKRRSGEQPELDVAAGSGSEQQWLWLGRKRFRRLRFRLDQQQPCSDVLWTPASSSNVSPADRPDTNYRPGGTSNYAPAGSSATRIASTMPVNTNPATGLPSGNVQPTSYDMSLSNTSTTPASASTPAYGAQSNTSTAAAPPAFASGYQPKSESITIVRRFPRNPNLTARVFCLVRLHSPHNSPGAC